MSSLKACKYKLYPNKELAEKLQWVLDHCRELYNAALQRTAQKAPLFQRRG